jgi:hypothetical protein
MKTEISPRSLPRVLEISYPHQAESAGLRNERQPNKSTILDLGNAATTGYSGTVLPTSPESSAPTVKEKLSKSKLTDSQRNQPTALDSYF